jgi:hypothetical protein
MIQNELYKSLKSIDLQKLSKEDINDLKEIFMAINNPLLFNQIAFMLGDLKCNDAVPLIIKKINQKDNYGRNGSLVYSLEDLNCVEYFLSIIDILCTQDYECRISALYIIEKYTDEISEITRAKAIEKLNEVIENEDVKLNSNEKNSLFHFIKEAIHILE